MTETSPHQKELDILQAALDIVGIEPTVGTIADVSNTIISLLRAAKDTEKDERNKHLIDAAISAVSIVPFGDLVKLIKLRKLRKPATKAARMVKTGVSKLPKSYGIKESMKMSEIKEIVDEVIAEELGNMKSDSTDAASDVASRVAQNMLRKKDPARAMKLQSDLAAQKWVQTQKQLPQKRTFEEEQNEGVGYVHASDRAKDPKSIKKPGGGTEHWRVKFQSASDLKKHGNTEMSKVNENMKNRELKQLIRESIEEVEQEVLKENQDQEEAALMKRIQAYAHWGYKNARTRPKELEGIFERIVKEIDALIKLSSEGGMVPIQGVKESEKRSPLGVTEETISKTKNLLDQMISQRRKK